MSTYGNSTKRDVTWVIAIAMLCVGALALCWGIYTTYPVTTEEEG